MTARLPPFAVSRRSKKREDNKDKFFSMSISLATLHRIICRKTLTPSRQAAKHLIRVSWEISMSLQVSQW